MFILKLDSECTPGAQFTGGVLRLAPDQGQAREEVTVAKPGMKEWMPESNTTIVGALPHTGPCLPPPLSLAKTQPPDWWAVDQSGPASWGEGQDMGGWLLAQKKELALICPEKGACLPPPTPSSLSQPGIQPRLGNWGLPAAGQ